ncbi:hypothetical protein CEXT_259891 [Caerostris extrusa]|uniref:Uncharacterized protein n=1 Tax=Caerostris extrusa TaxID=172846 RepID=A0AAV4TTZ0_CAEEX|nr:hypothetical protein CEXT_259891 [Caerostris extrusa]
MNSSIISFSLRIPPADGTSILFLLPQEDLARNNFSIFCGSHSSVRNKQSNVTCYTKVTLIAYTPDSLPTINNTSRSDFHSPGRRSTKKKKIPTFPSSKKGKGVKKMERT